jgi:Mrp family chromosome partitioning ATPase
MSASDTLSLPRIGLAVLDRLATIRPDGRLLMVSSARAGEGRSFVAMALARQFEALGFGRVLLVETRVSARPKGAPEGGFVGLLASGELADGAVRGSDRPNLSILPAGQGGADAEQLLFQPGPVGRALQHLRESWDLVVIDAPPLAACGSLAHQSDATLLVVDAQRTSGRVVQEAIDAARLPREAVAGVLINRQPGYLARWFGG